MSIYPNVIEQEKINLGKFAEQQENQRTIKIKNRVLKQDHDKKIAESFQPKIKNLTEMDKSTEKKEEVF